MSVWIKIQNLHFSCVIAVVQFGVATDDDDDGQPKKEVPFKRDPKFLQKLSKQNTHSTKDKSHWPSMKKAEEFDFDKKLLDMSDRDEEHIIVLGSLLFLSNCLAVFLIFLKFLFKNEDYLKSVFRRNVSLVL